MTFARATDGARIHYRQTGYRSGPPVIMIQGLGADKHYWNFQRIALASKYRTLALDNRGAGRSDKPHGPYTLQQMARDVISVLDDADVEQAHIVGASMGGAIGQGLTILHPERVRSLTLACTGCVHRPWRRELLSEWADLATDKGMRAMTTSAARWMIGPRSFRRLSPAIGLLGPLAMSRSAHAFAAQVDALLNVDESLAERLPEVDVPTLVIVGNQDILTPRGDAEDLAELIPTAELVVISGAAHGVMIEYARTFNRLLLEFLGRAEESFQRGIESAIDCSVQSS